MGRDDNASVATLICHSCRKLGDYKLAQIWYERALKTDPDHVKTWQYYGLWQIEQGNRDQAEYHLQKIAQLSGTASSEYRSLAAALAQPPEHRSRLLIAATRNETGALHRGEARPFFRSVFPAEACLLLWPLLALRLRIRRRRAGRAALEIIQDEQPDCRR